LGQSPAPYLSDDDRATITNVIDALIAKNKLCVIATGAS
jgi:hypothetical protein